MVIALPFTYLLVYKPIISTLWHLFHLSFGECEISLGVRAYSIFCEERGSSIKFAIFSFHQCFSSEKTFPRMKTKNFHSLRLSFSTQTILSPKPQKFSFIKLPWDRLTTYGLHSNIFNQNSWNKSHLKLKHVSLWSYSKIQLVYSCAKFELFGLMNWLFGLHDKFISSSINLGWISIKSGDHVQNISKLNIDILDCFKQF